MSENLLTLIVLFSPALFAAIAIASWFEPGSRPQHIIALSKIATLTGLLIAGLCSFFTYGMGLIESSLIGIGGIGLSIRLDSLSLVMLGMIALLGFVIVKFSINYLDGDKRQGIFLGRLAATIASVQLLVLSGNVGLLFISWVLTSVSLHRLLVFYHDRPGAQIAARKKFILARLGDLSLLIAITLLYIQYGSGNLEELFTAIKGMPGDLSVSLELAALFLALTAILKSAQFPTHGWLIEVMETPTPVSALLHAGLLNAGPFLIIRMAYVMDASTIAPLVLIGLGGFTALFASVVYLTQTSVKTALGYSSVGHMGFSLMVCGLGVYPAALLHLVAHSFYKAHSFLSSGSAIDILRSSKIIPVPKQTGIGKIVLGIGLALLVYAGIGTLWGIDFESELSLLMIGAVIIMGLARLFTSALAGKGNLKVFGRAILVAIVVASAFFALEGGIRYLLGAQVPEMSILTPGRLMVGMFILLAFGTAVFIQMYAPLLQYNRTYQALAIHLRNGLYANTWFDRLVNALHIHSEESRQKLETPIDTQLISEVNEEPVLVKELA